MRRRLPLMDATPAGKPLVLASARIAAAWAVGVADAAESEDSLAFAEEFGASLGRAGVPVRLALLAYEALPALPARARTARADAVAQAISRHAVSTDGALEPPLERAAGTVTVLVGAPALGSFAPALAVLLGSARAPTSTPPFLRALRNRVHLALPTPRAGLAAELAQRLLSCDFLPRA